MSYSLNAFKCNLKELTTKSALSARGQRSLGMRMRSSSLHWSCDSLGAFRFPSCWVFSADEVLSTIPPSSLGFVVFVVVFSTDVFPSDGCLFLSFCVGAHARLGSAVVPVMGALFQSRSWLPIVEAPGYSRHPTSILGMQLLISPNGHLSTMATFFCPQGGL